jgi:hypothetical protein
MAAIQNVILANFTLGTYWAIACVGTDAFVRTKLAAITLPRPSARRCGWLELPQILGIQDRWRSLRC